MLLFPSIKCSLAVFNIDFFVSVAPLSFANWNLIAIVAKLKFLQNVHQIYGIAVTNQVASSKRYKFLGKIQYVHT